jgi:hypothetical protein
MNDPSSTPELPPEAAKEPVLRQPIRYGKPAVDAKASGRRARLRHPARGAARH